MYSPAAQQRCDAEYKPSTGRRQPLPATSHHHERGTELPSAAPLGGRPVLTAAVPAPAAHNGEGAEPKPAVGDSASEAELLAMQQEIRDHLSRSELEVIVVLEGIDPHTSSTFQARHSYTAQDVVFDQMFVPSLSVGRDGRAVFDWNAFHEQQPVPFNRRHLIFGAHS